MMMIGAEGALQSTAEFISDSSLSTSPTWTSTGFLGLPAAEAAVPATGQYSIVLFLVTISAAVVTVVILGVAIWWLTSKRAKRQEPTEQDLSARQHALCEQ